MPDSVVSQVDVAEIGARLKRHRAAHGWSLREVEDQLGGAMTASSLSRIERGAIPDAKNVPVLAHWLGLPIELIAWPGQASRLPETRTTPDVVEVHLRADRNLDAGAAEVLSTMFRYLYESVAAGEFTLPPKAGKRPR